MDHVMKAPSCVICHNEKLSPFETAGGQRLICLNCHHSWRTTNNGFDQAGANMRPVLNIERLKSQSDHIAPYVVDQARVLEIGCATGDFARYARAHLPIATYDAFELSSVGELARPDVDRFFNVTLAEAVQRGDIQPNSYDLIVMSQVLEHFPDPVAAVHTISEILSDRGVFFLEIPNVSGHVSLAFDDNPAHPHFFSVSSLTRMHSDAGLQCLSLMTNMRTEARYSDSIRVISRRFQLPRINMHLLDPNNHLGNLIVWCCGTTTYDIIGNDFELEKLLFFVDKNPAMQSRPFLGKEVKPPEAILDHPNSPILICSINAYDEVEKEIKRMFEGQKLPPIYKIGDMLDRMAAAKRC
jgi:hypothetical protein